MDLNVVVLAAGKGVRMGSQLPKVLHPVAGSPMLARILNSASRVGAKQIRVVVGYGEDVVSSVAGKFKALCFKQNEESYGTGQAVIDAKVEELNGDVLIINGDHPLINPSDLIGFIRHYKEKSLDLAVASFKQPKKSHYGRLVFEGEKLVDIVEAYETSQEKNVSEFINAGVYLVKADLLKAHLPSIKKNVKEEKGLTDLISLFYEKGLKTGAIPVEWNVAFGVNNQRELSLATAIAFESNCYKHMDQGVVVVDVRNTYIEDDVVIGKGTLLYPNVQLRGKTKIGGFCAIESGAYIHNSLIHNYVNVKQGSYIEGSIVGEKSVIGPYAHLRPETEIKDNCKVGNFVETKRTTLGSHSKASHLAYLGDSTIGNEVNIGAGVVTCNFAPSKIKSATHIKDKAFIGSGAQLVAPVEIEEEAVVAAGSVITKKVEKGELAIERSNQKNIKNYKPKKKSK